MTAAARATSAPIPSDPEEELARVLLVQACEESDPEARFVPRREREEASRLARAEAGGPAQEPQRLVVARARPLSSSLERRHPSLRSLRGAVRLRVPGLPVLAAAGLVGLAADALGAERRVNLLAFPLLTLLAWNAAVYVALALGPWLSRGERAGRLAAAVVRAAGWIASRRPGLGAPDAAHWLVASLRRFTGLWSAQVGPLLAARARRLLHLAALGFAAGIVAGMYVRGLAFEYRASWESTFLDTPAVSRLLSGVLGPAAHGLDALRPDAGARALLGADSLAGLRAPRGDGPAATWIHLWALTTGAVIVVPRAALAWREGRRARRLARSLAPRLDEPYFLRLLAPDRGAGVRVEVLPYSHRLAPASNDALLELLHELFGNRARIEVAEPLPYGAEPPAGGPGAGHAQARVVVFNLAQPPEEEVHGSFLAELRRQTGAHGEGRRPLLVLLDEAPYRSRLGASEGLERLAQRWRAWERVGRGSDLRFAPLRPLDRDADETLERARSALAHTLAGEAA